jgi:hypothetical protein
MKPLNLKVALILITIGIVLLVISVVQYQAGQLQCTLTGDLCAQFAAQGARDTAIQFLEISLAEVALMSIATMFLVMGRNQGTRQATGPS